MSELIEKFEDLQVTSKIEGSSSGSNEKENEDRHNFQETREEKARARNCIRTILLIILFHRWISTSQLRRSCRHWRKFAKVFQLLRSGQLSSQSTNASGRQSPTTVWCLFCHVRLQHFLLALWLIVSCQHLLVQFSTIHPASMEVM